MFQVPFFLEQGGFDPELLYDGNIIEEGCVFSMQKFDWVQDRTYMIGHGGRTTTALLLGRRKEVTLSHLGTAVDDQLKCKISK